MNKKMNKFINTHDGSRNESIDGTGVLPSVNLDSIHNIVKYIQENIITEGKIIDFGAGIGHFQKYCEENTNFEVYSVEGCGDIPFLANREKWIVKDLGVPFKDDFNKEFNLVVSFEVIEHIVEEKQQTLFDNIKLCADKALFSIHTKNQQDHLHSFIRDEEWWIKKFSEFFPNEEWEVNILLDPSNSVNHAVCTTDEWKINKFKLKNGDNVVPWGCSIIAYAKKIDE